MPMIDFIGQTANLKKVSLSSVRSINYETMSLPTQGAKTKNALVTTPGAELIQTISTDDSIRGRGLYISSKGTAPDYQPRLYGAFGNAVYRWDVNRATTYVLGYIADDAAKIYMTDNGFQFVVCDGTNIYTCPLDHADGLGSLTAITLPYVPGTTTLIEPTHVEFVKQRIVCNASNTNRWFYSELPQGALGDIVINQENFYSAEFRADPIRSIIVANGSLWVHGFRTYEIWRPSDNDDDPFDFVGGAQAEVGIEAPDSIAKSDDKLFWLGSSVVGYGGVYMGESMSIKRISDESIEEKIRSYSNQESAIGQAFSSGGDSYYALTFEQSNSTFVYNASLGLWHERAYRNQDLGTWTYWPYQFITVIGGIMYAQVLAGGGYLVKIDEDKYTEWNGTNIYRQYTGQSIWDNLNKIQLRLIRLDMEVGATEILDPSVYGSDPKILMEISFDGGYTFGNKLEQSMGKQGEYKRSVRFITKGVGESITPRITCSEPVPHAIYQGRIDYAQCGRT